MSRTTLRHRGILRAVGGKHIVLADNTILDRAGRLNLPPVESTTSTGDLQAGNQVVDCIVHRTIHTLETRFVLGVRFS